MCACVCVCVCVCVCICVSTFVCVMCVNLWYPVHVCINPCVVKINVSAHAFSFSKYMSKQA